MACHCPRSAGLGWVRGAKPFFALRHWLQIKWDLCMKLRVSRGGHCQVWLSVATV